ncbi:META domain-containing protein [Neisseria canis]|uniref:META domain n=1 Tax=Neisseria canis TaxID=493 RepID=A0A1X3D0I9_9NEIS|nr:META domain-containing protein [Neisseria canis]OSI13204.1 hypothetical protein BWD07_01055 [Neisseria canis]VEF01928.1 META domain [Neisseria canis]
MNKVFAVLTAICLTTACATPMQKSSLTGVWQIQQVEEIRPEYPTTIEFNQREHRFHTEGGCNNISGRYREHNGKIQFTDPMMTLKACEQSLMTLDRSLSAVVEGAASYRINGQQLEIRNAQGQTLLKAVKAAQP